MRYAILIVFILGISKFQAQFKFDYKDSIKVSLAGTEFKLPWFGGLNYAQFSEIDFDFDGDQDLFIFDRSRDNIRLLEQIEENSIKKYKQVHSASTLFPEDLRYRVALVDFNLDGKNDIFTYGIGGVKVFKNTGNVFTGLSWELVTDLLYSDYNGDYNNLYVSSSDIPAYVDVDFDGDIDILTFEISGERVEYHQNQSQELYGHSDSLKFVLKNRCWGAFTEDAITSEIVLNASNTECNAGNVTNPQLSQNDNIEKLTENQNFTRHAGSTILAFDYDNSGVYDLVLGDVNLNSLALLLNGGTDVNTNSAMNELDLNFPSNTTPANVSIFPAAYYIDVDFDSKKDLLVTPSAKGISQNEKSIYFYKNIGTSLNPVFNFQSKNYFQSEMLEVGTGSIPVFVDQNGDGLKDLLIANFFKYKEPLSKESAIVSFVNVGNVTTPEFTFFESNFMNLTSQDLGLRFVPAFGDIDSDGDQDLFLGLDNGNLNFYENIAGAGNPLSFSNPISNFTDNNGTPITTSSYCFPQLFDLNEDGKLDLILGKKTGEIMFYENIGTPQNPSFALKNGKLGEIDVATASPDGYPTPHFFKFEDTIRLFLGAFDGKIRFYDGISEHLDSNETFNLISDNFLGINADAYSSCWINDIDNDGNLNMFVGGDLGGIFHLEHDENSNLSLKENKKEKPQIIVSPNPSSGLLNLVWSDKFDSNSSFEISNILGEIVFFSDTIKSNIDITMLPNGIYFLKIKSEKELVLKVVKQ
jgi:hypothetical protein